MSNTRFKWDKKGRRRIGISYAYLAPTLILMVILLMVPIIMVIRYSFFDNVIVNKNPVFVGLQNYKTV